MTPLDNILKFVKLTHDFQKIERVIYATGQDRMENDIEHSYQLALCAWYIITTSKMNLDAGKAVHYALIHDLVEVYAGDTDAFDKDQSRHDSKVDREHQALLRLKDEFPEFPELIEMIEAYEKRVDEESQFVYALDKIVAPINIYLDGGRTWKKKGVTLTDHINNKQDKVKAHPQIEEYFHQLTKKFESEKETLFPNETV